MPDDHTLPSGTAVIAFYAGTLAPAAGPGGVDMVQIDGQPNILHPLAGFETVVPVVTFSSNAPVYLSGNSLRVLRMTAEGLSNLEIAKELGISRNTVKSHVCRGLRRLGARNRVDLVVKAHQRGIATLAKVGATVEDPPLELALPVDLPTITADEARLFWLVAQDLSNEDIAARVFYAERTVARKVFLLLQRLGISRAQAVAFGRLRAALEAPDA